MAVPRRKRRPLPAKQDGQPADLAPTITGPTGPGTRRVGQQPKPERGLNWPWLLADRGILTISCLVAGLGILGLIMMWFIANRLHGVDRANLQIDAIKYGLGFIAAGGAAAALLLGVRRQQHTEHAQKHTELDAAERRVTDLYTKAVEQIGHADAAVRLGGLYALQRVAQDNVEQRQTVVNVLCAYLRMPYTPFVDPNRLKHTPIDSAPPESPLSQSETAPASGRDPRQELQVRLTAQRIITGHLALPDKVESNLADLPLPDTKQLFWPDIDIDLTGATLVNWNMSHGRGRNVSFRGAAFFGDAWFDTATFTGIASFGGATFAGDAWFGGTTFTSNARFGKATFTGNARFDKATFSGGAWFGGATFSRDARFGAATFTGGTSFDKVTFSCSARFGKAIFAGKAGFGKTNFCGGTWFDKATFFGTAWFGAAVFSGDARFGAATFTGSARFGKAIFTGNAEFGAAAFSGSAWFGKVTFSGDARFGGATFSGDLGFGGATFTGSAEFDTAKFASAPMFHEVRIVLRENRQDIWPSGWRVELDTNGTGKLVFEKPAADTH